MMVSYEELLQVCAKYSADNYFVGDAIPQKKLLSARQHYLIPAHERFVALVDSTAFGSAKNGLAICETGVYVRDLGEERKYFPWSTLVSLPIEGKGTFNARLEIGGNQVLALGGSAFKKEEVAKLLSELQPVVKYASRVAPPTTIADAKWMLAVDGRQFGPYELPTLRSMVAERRIDPNECLVWKEGMPSWVRFHEVPSLAALLRDAPGPPAMPPPLPTAVSPAPEDTRTQMNSPQRPRDSAGRGCVVSYDELFQVCVKYSGSGYYIGETIAEKKLTAARSSFRVPDTEQVVALLDTTLLGSSKNGLAVCTGGIYWRDAFTDAKKLTWAEFTSADIKPKDKIAVEIGEQNEFQPAGGMDRDDALRLLSEIQMLIKSSSTVRGATGDLPSTRVPGNAEKPSSRASVGDAATRVLPQIDLNHAPVDDLLSLPAISLPNSQKLIRERELRAGFDTVDEVGYFLGLQPHQVERLKQRVTVEPYKGARTSGGRVIDF